jgi:ABC-type transporter Mla subunit MlaD
MKMSGSVDELTNTLSKSMGLTSGASDANDAQKQSIQNVAKSIQNMYDDANTTEEQKRELAELTGVIATLKTQIPQVGEIIEAEILVAGGLKKYIDDQFVGGEDLMRKLQNQPDIDVGDLPDAIKDMKFVADAVTSGKAPGNVGNTDLSARDIIANTLRVDNFDITPFEKGSAEVLGGQGVLPSNMMAMLHKGERVLNASETNAYNALESKANTFAEQASAFQGGMSNSGGTVAEKLDNLNQTMLQLVNINMQVNDTARRQLKGIKGMSGNVMTGFNV